jgi:glycosyltransferase involved in cell wall biosynthesis
MTAASLTFDTIAILSWTTAMIWLVHALAVVKGMASLPDVVVGPSAESPNTDGGQITVIVPARNEGATIQTTLRSLAASRGVRLQIIAINDRSTDETGVLMENAAAEVAAAGSRHTLEVLHVSELPPGWLGKPHAMALAAKRARSPRLLFTDGDVVFHPDALAVALHEAEIRGADHLVVPPTVILKSAGERAMLATMNALSQWMIRLWKVNDARAKDYIGVGAFNMIRREVYEAVGGFEALRMEVLDDLRLGWMLKRAGYRQVVILGKGLVQIRWLRGAFNVIGLAEKNAFSAFRFRTAKALLASLGMLALAVIPLIAIAVGGWSMVAGVLTYIGFALTFWGNRKVTAAPPWLAILYAPAILIVVYALLRSMTLALVRNGIDWRGTRYSLADLRRNAGSGW